MAGRLVVCPTPIGNLEDVTLRVLSALRDADVVACEDTRRTRVLLDRFGVKAHLVSYHEHNEEARARELVQRMRGGETVALVSDAGMPLVSDPGFVLVREAVAAGLGVEVLPGPSAVLTALVASGLPAERWRFAGFLPRKRAELRALFAAPETLVAFESPRRVAERASSAQGPRSGCSDFHPRADPGPPARRVAPWPSGAPSSSRSRCWSRRSHPPTRTGAGRSMGAWWRASGSDRIASRGDS